jgi:type I restriction enzyme R subunit
MAITAAGPEYEQVERPLLGQLTRLGWAHLEGAPPGAAAPNDPAASGRAAFSEIFLEERLREQLRRINRGPDGRPWLDDVRVSQAVGTLTRLSAPSLLEANLRATGLLLTGITVEGLPGWHGGRDQRVHFIDWETPTRNDFTVISQFRVDIPGTQGRRYIVPDEVLLVNGIPLVLVECKRRGAPIAEAVSQHLRYADRRNADTPEGSPRLFHTLQLLVATSGEAAVLGTVSSHADHYAPWRDPYPLTRDELARRMGKAEATLTQQDILTESVLHPVRLLDIVHNYVTFMTTSSGRTVKVVPRYQQYRAVSRAVERLEHRPTRAQDRAAGGEGRDLRGGIIWHTQGSGKSLTMSFLVRKMRTVPGLRKTKIVVVTDRTQLQKQLSETMALADEPVDVAKKISRARQLLSRHGPGLVFVMIQKQQDEEKLRARSRGATTEASPEGHTSSGTGTSAGAASKVDVRVRPTGQPFEDVTDGGADLPAELNTDESIVVLIDEAHRSHDSALHAHLMAALPNCARIGFTGTPILMGKRKHSTEIFGEYIDVYRLADAEADRAVVPIFYAGRTVKGAVRDGRDMDEVFEDMLADHTPQEQEQIKRRYATRGDVLEATELIQAKARNMLRHYIETVLPNGLKAQVVAHSRRAAVQYRDAFLLARDELVAEIEALPKTARDASPDELTDRRTAFLVRASRQLDLRALDFVPVISGAQNDPKSWEAWTDSGKRDAATKAFTSPFPVDPTGPVPAFLLVKSMLLTGFDAPVEQVLYLDRPMQGAELLQAIARVNRPADGKNCGYVIDYVGVTRHLTAALKEYAAEDVRGSLADLSTQVAALDDLRRRVVLIFTGSGITPARDTLEECVLLLSDGELRDQFEAELAPFLATVDTVLPMPEALPYLSAVRLFTEIAKRARRRYRDGGDFDPSLYGAKVRELIDEHMAALGVNAMLPPVSITDPEYVDKVARLGGSRARASEMEHAIRHHISVHIGEDPTRYRRLSERLEQVLADHAGNWEQQTLSLGALLAETRADAVDDDGPAGSRRLGRLESALYGLLAEETATGGTLEGTEGQVLADFCRRLHKLAARQTTRMDFWRHDVDQYAFRDEVTVALIEDGVGDLDGAPELADKLFEIIKANRHHISRSS